MRQIGRFGRPAYSVQMEIVMPISGDITVNFGPNSIAMIKHIWATQPHIEMTRRADMSRRVIPAREALRIGF